MALNFPDSPTDGQIYNGFQWDATPGVWRPVASAPSLAGLSDTDIVSPTAGEKLVYDGTNWVNTDAKSGDNLLYNGAMQVAQRGTSGTAGGFQTVDRWGIGRNIGAFTETVEADGPTGSGFTKSLKVECTTADASPSASAQFYFRQRLEGQDLQGLKKGSSSAESLTLSFWVKSNVTGTYIVALFDDDNSRMICASYSVSVSGTWENKTVTFDGDTTGVLDNDNSNSLALTFWLAAGSDFTSGTLATSWATSTAANRAVGQTNLAAATSNYWQITGVQLEAGEVATPFEHKPYGVELAECQRYYQQAPGDVNAILGFACSFSTTQVRGFLSLAVPLRTTPTVVTAPAEWRGDGGVVTTSGVAFVREEGPVVRLNMDLASSVTGSTGGGYEGSWELDAEL